MSVSAFIYFPVLKESNCCTFRMKELCVCNQIPASAHNAIVKPAGDSIPSSHALCVSVLCIKSPSRSGFAIGQHLGSYITVLG